MQRFYISVKNIGRKEIEISDSSQIHQIKNVLRLKIGDCFKVFSDDGAEYGVEIAKIDAASIVARIVSINESKTQGERTELILFIGLLKKDKFEWVLQKGTEIGISCFVPLITRHCVKKIIHTPPRWKKIIQEAAEQCGTVTVPTVEEPVKFKDAVVNTYDNILFHPSAEDFLSQNMFSERPTSVGIWIGPEGGFSEDEIQTAKEKNFMTVNGGKNILRAETAAIVYPALVQFLL